MFITERKQLYFLLEMSLYWLCRMNHVNTIIKTSDSDLVVVRIS